MATSAFYRLSQLLPGYIPARGRASALKAIPSPRATLIPRLSDQQIAGLPYPPDLFPGARDVDSPYGKLRVYEWGPEEGRKMVMLSGDTSPAPIFSIIAKHLAHKGCRMLVIDAWGRGYSDSPLSVRYDIRLFTLQILFAVVSSTLSWTGASQSFSIIGYSLGGSIGMAFASRFPTMVESIVLLGPGGLIRTVPEGYGSIFFRYQQWIPSFYLHRLIARTLGLQARKQYDYPSEPKVNQLNPVEKLHAIWQWQFDQHEGFIHSFANTAQNGPIQHQHEEWQRACDIICGKGSPDVISRLRDSQVLVVCGRNDEVIIFDELVEDLEKLLPNHVVIRTVDGGHEFPIVSGEATSNLICEFLSI